jgi:hypothetical protein
MNHLQWDCFVLAHQRCNKTCGWRLTLPNSRPVHVLDYTIFLIWLVLLSGGTIFCMSPFSTTIISIFVLVSDLEW